MLLKNLFFVALRKKVLAIKNRKVQKVKQISCSSCAIFDDGFLFLLPFRSHTKVLHLVTK
jgi:hypothetical protein